MSLKYSISREWLSGEVGNKQFSVHASSGGGRGRTGSGADDSPESYDPYRKEKGKGVNHIHGGPIPPGAYICHYLANYLSPNGTHFGECIYLEQTITSMFGFDKKSHSPRPYLRGGLLIHGQGPHGSDGCIVPHNEAIRHRLNEASKHPPAEPGALNL